MDLIEELLGLVDALHAGRVDYAVCGGIALAIHGHPRFTADIDMLAQARDLERVRIVARKRGFTLDGLPVLPGAGTSKERELVPITKADGSHSLTLALLHGGNVLARVWQTRGRIAWRGRELHVVSLEGLLGMTRLSGRAQDLADIEALTRRPDGGSAVAEKLPDLPTPEEVDRRLRELEQLYALGKALREVRFVEEPPKSQADRVRERPAV